MNSRIEDESSALLNVSPEQAIEMFGPIPEVISNFTITPEQVPEEFGHVTHPTQVTMYFDEMMRIMGERGLGFHILLENGIRPSVLSSSTHLGRDLKVGDEVVMTTATSELEKQIKFEQAMKRGEKEVSKNTYIVDIRGLKRGIPMHIPVWVSERLRTDINSPETVSNE